MTTSRWLPLLAASYFRQQVESVNIVSPLGEAHAVKVQPVFPFDRLEELRKLIARRVRVDIVKLYIGDEQRGELEDQVFPVHGEVYVRVRFYVVRVHITVELCELRPVHIAVAGRVPEDHRIGVELIPCAEVVFAVGIVAAPGILILFWFYYT